MNYLYQEATRNQLANTNNPYQGDSRKALCVCSAGLLRSPTIAKVLTERGYNTRACGTSLDYALVPISQALVLWADEIYVVEEQAHVVEEIVKVLGLEKPPIIHSLPIPDMYETFDVDLIKMIKKQVEKL